MIKKLYLPLLMAVMFVFTSCSSKMGELSSDYFTTTPQVLEAVIGLFHNYPSGVGSCWRQSSGYH